MRFKIAAALSLLGTALYGHAVSISTGELRVEGPTAALELRIPMYEVPKVSDPGDTLLNQLRFGDGHRTHASCAEERGTFVCRAQYEFPELHPDTLTAECRLYEVTVPNHIHLLTAIQGSNSDQIVFDQTLTQGEIRFHPPSRAEIVARESAAGVRKAVWTAAGLLFLIGLALASRSSREAFTLIAVFLASEWLARPLGPRLPLALTARFFEAVLALTVVYLAVEIVALPEGRARWLVVAALGLCHGISFAGFPSAYLAGASVAQTVLAGLLAAGVLRMPQGWRRPAAAALLVSALGWFGWQWRGPA